MQKKKSLYYQLLISVVLPLLIGCNSPDSNPQNTTTSTEDTMLVDSLIIVEQAEPPQDNVVLDPIQVIVVQCANGYEYGMHSYDFNPIIGEELNKETNITVKPFPLKKLMGVAYQGVFDKRYCPPIIEKVEADILILTRFDKEYQELRQGKKKWGYELRLVNTTTLEQKNSIYAHNLDSYQALEQHIKDHILTLQIDIEQLILQK